MTATQAPTPGPLDSESVKLLVKGDLLLCADRIIRSVEQVDAERGVLWFTDGEACGPSVCAFIGRPKADGWMPWSGGENPVPGQRVERKERSGDLVWCACLSDDLRWSHSGWDTDIIAFRLAPTALVEASGSERDGPLSDLILKKLPVRPTPEMLAAAEELEDANGHLRCGAEQVWRAMVEAWSPLPSPQPSGETRDAVARVLEPWGPPQPGRGPVTVRRWEDALAKADAILALLSRPAPVASGGQHSSGEGWQGMETAPQDGSKVDLWGYWSETGTWKRSADASWDDERCDWKADGWYAGQYLHPPRWTHWRAVNGPSDTTPALAEAQDEGAAGDLQQALTLALALLGQMEPTDARAVSDEFVAMAAAQAGIQNQEGRDIIAARLKQPFPSIPAEVTFTDAHPSPTPAADADKLRILADRVTAEVKRGADGSHVQALGALSNIEGLVLAALKSTAAQGGE